MKRYLLSSIFIAALGLLQSAATAADRPDLAVGMSMAEVLTRWGEPTERIEQESRRREIWVYSGTVVTFQQGAIIKLPVLATVPGLAATARPREASTSTTVSHKPVVAPPAPATLHQTQRPAAESSDSDVIAEVLREMPAQDEKPRSGSHGGPRSGPPIRPTPSGLPPPMMPPQDDSMGMGAGMEDTP